MGIAVLRNAHDLHAALAAWRQLGEAIAFVPTMGALHEGHLALMRQARQAAPRVVASIFVNPLQFGPNEDFTRYPRQEKEDVAALESAGVDAVFMPSVEEIYPPGHSTLVSVKGVSEGLCGAFRPGHFDGVATVVARLFLMVQPDIAVFGEKDYQQLQVVRRMVRDLGFAIRILGAPIVREADGLALSSRNRYLSAEERVAAPNLHRALAHAAGEIVQGKGPDEAINKAKEQLTDDGFRVEYMELRDRDTLEPARDITKPTRLLAAAWLGKTRLIDNVAVEKP